MSALQNASEVPTRSAAPPQPQHVVFATFGSHGDVHPFIGLGLAMKARGHRVTLHTSVYFRELIERTGLEFSGFGSVEDFERGIKNPLLWSRRKGATTVFGVGVKEGLRKSYAELSKIVTRDTILVNSSLVFSARVLHDQVGCPGATVHLAPAVMRSSERPAKLPGLFMPAWLPLWLKEKIWEVGDKRFIDPLICPTLNELRSEIGLAKVDRVLNGWWNSKERIIGLWPEWYGPAASDWPAQFRHAGFPLYDEAGLAPLPEPLEEFLAKGDAPIAFTPGSAMMFGSRFFEAAINACVATGRRGVLLSRHAEHIPKNLPPTVLHALYAPFSALLPRCCAIVHHGGIGTTSQALQAGIPQVITHFAHDQPDNALRLQGLGVGSGISGESVTGRKLAKHLSRLLSDRHTLAACKATAGRVTSGIPRACDLLEALAHTDAHTSDSPTVGSGTLG